MDMHTSQISVKKRLSEQKLSGTLKVAIVTNNYTPVLPIIVEKCNIDLLIHNQPLLEARSISHRFKILASHIIFGQTNIVNWAKRHRITEYSMQQFSQSEIATYIRQHDIDVLISYFAPKLDNVILQAPKQRAINVHPSNLPDYRGGNPLLWQVMDGVKLSAVTAHELSAELDCGDILYKQEFSIPDGISKAQLSQQVSMYVSKVFFDVLQRLRDGGLKSGIPQPLESPTAYAYNIKREKIATKIPWADLPGRSLYNLMTYLGYLPIELTESSGLSPMLPMRAERYLERPVNENTGLVRLEGHWYFNSSKGAVRLKRCWSPISLIRHWRTYRAHRSGRLKNAYI